jgi:hypothetical protein
MDKLIETIKPFLVNIFLFTTLLFLGFVLCFFAYPFVSSNVLASWFVFVILGVAHLIINFLIIGPVKKSTTYIVITSCFIVALYGIVFCIYM